MLISIFLTALLNKVIVCYEDSNESRYIDLLPEEEKEQFLERIARRILEDGNVKDNNNNKHSVEITENQLNEHNEFVQKILKEESENLRRNNDNTKNKDENGASEIVKSLDKTEHILEDEKGIDLTVQNKKQNSYDIINTDNDTYIDVAVKYDNENLDHEEKDTENPVLLIDNENNKIHESEIVKSIHHEPKRSDTEDIQVKNIDAIKIDKSLDIANAEIVEHSTEENSTLRQYQSTTDKVDFQQITEIETDTKIEPFPDKIAMISDFTKINNDSHLHIDTATDTSTTEFTKTLAYTETIKISKNDTKIIDGSEKIRSGVNYKETNSYKDDQKSFHNTKENASKHDNYPINKIQLKNESPFPDNLKSQINNKSGYKIKSDKNMLNQSKVDIKKVESSLGPLTKKVKTVRAKKNVIKLEDNLNKESQDILKTNDSKDDIAKDFLKALRLNLLKEDLPSNKNNRETSKQSNNEQKSEYSLKSKLKEYNVYEIPEDKPAFTLQSKSKDTENEEQPYYIPIYNYSPNKAYFNAQNRYGPNFDDSKLVRDSSDITDKENRSNDGSRKNNKERKFNFVKRSVHNTRFTNINKAKHSHSPVQFERATFPLAKRLVPGDYVNADYYFGKRDVPYPRAQSNDKPNKKFPASDEETHPFSNLNKVKSNIRAIRQILFEQKRFGYVKEVNSSEFESAETEDYIEVETTTEPYFKLKRKRTNVDSSEEDSNSMDYYLSRSKMDSPSNEYIDNLAKKLHHIKYLDNTKYLYLPPNAFKNNRYEIMKSNGVAFLKETKLDNHVHRNLRIKKISPTSKPVNKIYSSTPKTVKQSGPLYDPFKSIIDMTAEKDLLQTLEKLQALNMTKTRSNGFSAKLDPFVEVMKDMIYQNSRALKVYDWLGTTVNIQAAIKKLQDLIESLRKNEKIHPSDFQLLKYVMYLYAESKMSVQSETYKMSNSDYGLRNMLLSKIRTKRKNHLKNKGLIERVWLLKREGLFDSTTGKLFKLNDFLYDLQNALFDFHEAIKNIASVTNVRNQRWFENIKELYLNGDRRQLLKIILHLSATRLFDIIEENSADVEANLAAFLNENKEVVRETVKEFKFILILLKEIISLN